MPPATLYAVSLAIHMIFAVDVVSSDNAPFDLSPSLPRSGTRTDKDENATVGAETAINACYRVPNITF